MHMIFLWKSNSKLPRVHEEHNIHFVSIFIFSETHIGRDMSRCYLCRLAYILHPTLNQFSKEAVNHIDPWRRKKGTNAPTHSLSTADPLRSR